MSISGPSTSTGTPGQAPASGATLLLVGPQPQTPVPIPGWIGIFAGLNKKVPAPRIGEYECADIKNLLIDAGSLKLRTGRTAVMDTLTVSSSWTAHGGHRVYSLGTTPYDYLAGNFDGTRKIKTNRSGSWADLISGYAAPLNQRVEFIGAKSAVYIFFGSATENPRKVTGADSVANTAWAATVKPSMGCWHKKRLWTDDVLTAGRLRLSDTDDPDTMRAQTSATIVTQGGYIDNLIPDGDKITSISSFGSRLVVTSERSTHLIEGSNFSNMVITSTWQFGTKSPRSVRLCENDLWLLDSTGIVRFISGSQPNVTALVAAGVPGYYIEPLTMAISQTNLVLVHALYHNRRYWLFFPTSQALSWDFRELPVPGSRWTYHDSCPFGASWKSGSGTDSEDFYVLRDDIPTMCKFLNGTTDQGAAISYLWKSRAFDWQYPVWKNGLERVSPQLLGVTGNVTVKGYADLSGSAAFSKTLTYAGVAYERQSTGQIAAAVLGQVIQTELSGSTAIFECSGIENVPVRQRQAV